MLIQIWKVLYIFVLYFRVVLRKVGNSLMENQFSRTRHQRIIITAPCPRGSNLRNPYLCGPTTSVLKGSRPQNVLPPSCFTTHPPLKLPTTWLKHFFLPKIAHSCTPYHWAFSIKLTCVMRVLYITKKKQYWLDSHNTIPFFVCPNPIHSNTSPLNNSCITTSFNMRGQTFVLDLANPTVIANGGNKKLSNMIPSNVTWPFNANQPSQSLICILNKFL